MSNPLRRQAKEKQRRKQIRLRKARQLRAERCDRLLFDAETEWHAKRSDRAEHLLGKVLRINPHHTEAHLHLAELCFIARRFEDGLRHFAQVPVDEVPTPLVFYAADASLAAGEFDRGETLACEYLRRLGRGREADSLRAAGRILLDQCRKGKRVAARAARATRDGQPDLFERRKGPAETHNGHPAHRPSTFGMQPQGVDDVGPAARLAGDSGTDGRTIEVPKPAPLAVPPFPEPVIPPIPVNIEVDPGFLPSLHNPIAASREALLWREYAAVRLRKGFDELVSFSDVHDVDHLWYQLETVRRILRDFRGRVLLADEVGLGKTIEACLTLKEYWVRGLVRRALVLTPPSLVGQWVDELSAKFRLEAVTPESPEYGRDAGRFWTTHPIVVASLPLARQPANRSILTRVDYDLVIVDEAHRLKRRGTAAWQLVNELKKRFLFLLSATPVGNDLTELYNLILLLRPGLLSTEARFRREYGGVEAIREPAKRERLRMLLREVMVRNTRAHIDLRLPRRLAATIIVEPDAEEAACQDAVTAWIRERYATATGLDRHGLMTLQMRAGSSGTALLEGIHRAGADGAAIRNAADTLTHRGLPAKRRRLVDLLRRSPDKAIVFTRFLATQQEVQTTLETAGIGATVFHGGLSGAAKDAAIAAFASDAQVLINGCRRRGSEPPVLPDSRQL